jgi:hypothetical protein
MRRWLIGVWLSLFIGPSPANALPPDPIDCQPNGLATADNDIRLRGDQRPPGKSIALPDVVRDQLRAAAARLLSRVGRDMVDGFSCADLFRPVYRISDFGDRDLFVGEIAIGIGGSFFYLVLHDPVVRRPFVSSADLFRNGRRQIVFEERVHNGTMYNGVIYHYFDIGPKLELTRVLARETRVEALDRDNGLYVRELTQLSPTRLRLDTVSLRGNREARRQALGFVLLESPGPGVAFRVVERHPMDTGAHVGLVSVVQAPEDEDRFLREGYRLYY